MAEATIDRKTSPTTEEAAAEIGGRPPSHLAQGVPVDVIRTSRQAHEVWRSMRGRLKEPGTLLLDMAQVRCVERGAIAALIRFVQRAHRAGVQLQMTRVRRDVHSMLELLGVHHLVEFTDLERGESTRDERPSVVQKTQA